jgi:hypothetical protein
MVYGRVKRAVNWWLEERPPVRRALHSTAQIVNREYKNRPDIPITQSLRLYRQGFLSEAVPMYGIDEGNRDQYVSHLQRERTKLINGRNGRMNLVTQSKLLFQYVLWPEFAEQLPDVYGYADDGRLVDTPFSRGYDDLRSCIDHVGRAVAKPVFGETGQNVYVVERTDGGYSVNGTAKSDAEFDRFAADLDDFLVTEFAEQTDYAGSIAPSATNTLRIMTMIDPDTGEPFVAAGVHRFGSERSAPVDNFSKGGVVAAFDPETGRIGRIAEEADDKSIEYYDHHPDTGARVEGVEVPAWSEIRETLLEMAAYVDPMMQYVGWDVVVTDDEGSFTVIEGNGYPTIDLVQIHTPLLADERNRRFYEHHGIV